MKLIKFWATWCGPCRMLAPQIDKLSNDPDLAGVEFVSVDIDQDSQAAIDFQVMSVPTVVLVDGENELYRTVGVKSADKLKAELGPYLATQP